MEPNGPSAIALRWSGTACLLVGLWLALAGEVSASEAVTGVVAALFTAAWFVAGARTAVRSVGHARGAARRWMRAVGELPAATARTGAALARVALIGGDGGGAVRARFRYGRADDAEDSGRRATAVLAASLSPDRFVVRAVPGEADALLHALVPGNPPDPEWMA